LSNIKKSSSSSAEGARIARSIARTRDVPTGDMDVTPDMDVTRRLVGKKAGREKKGLLGGWVLAGSFSRLVGRSERF
jgi:hypothetical protein